MQRKYKNLKMIFLGLVISLFLTAFSSFLFLQNSADNGAWIYSAFDEVLNVGEFSTHNPLWPDSLEGKTSASKSWRCSTCHGWNYQGAVTIAGEVTNYPGLDNVTEMDDEEISNWIDGTINKLHDFSKYLTIESKDQLLSFFRDNRFKKWVEVNEIEIIDSGSSFFGEEIFKDICIECHGTDGAKINLGSVNKPIFLGDFMVSDQSRVVHHLEFGKVDHEKLTTFDEELEDMDLINLTKYLRAMPVSSTIIEEQEILQLRAFQDQGDLDLLLYAGFTLFFILITAYILISIREQKQSDEELY